MQIRLINELHAGIFPSIVALAFMFVLGLVFFFFPRRQHGLSWQGVTGGILVAIPLIVILRPALLPELMLEAGIMTHVGPQRDMDVYANQPDEEADAKVNELITMFRDRYDQLIPSIDGDCHANVIILRTRDAIFSSLLAPRLFGYGHYRPRDLFFPATVTHIERGGIGSLGHHLAYHLTACAGSNYPAWVRTGLGTLAEKFLLLQKVRQPVLSLGYRSNWRDPVLRQAGLPSLKTVILQGTDQYTLQSFFVFLNYSGLLKTVLAAVNSPPFELEDRFAEWFSNEALVIPKVVASDVIPTVEESALLESNLQSAGLAWDNARGMYLDPMRRNCIIDIAQRGVTCP